MIPWFFFYRSRVCLVRSSDQTIWWCEKNYVLKFISSTMRWMFWGSQGDDLDHLGGKSISGKARRSLKERKSQVCNKNDDELDTWVWMSYFQYDEDRWMAGSMFCWASIPFQAVGEWWKIFERDLQSMHKKALRTSSSWRLIGEEPALRTHCTMVAVVDRTLGRAVGSAGNH